MKTLIFNLILSLVSGYCFAQPNNPYNQRGIDYTNSVNMITSDFNAGKVKEFNDETVSQYSKLIPLQNQASMEMVTTIMKTVKAPGFSITNVIDNGPAADYTKQTLKEFLNPKNLSTDDLKRMLTGKVDEITKARIPQTEKEFLLSMSAIVYNNLANPGTRRAECGITTGENTTNIPCSVAGAVIGGTIGLYICGIWCALGGAVVGAIIGSVC